MFDRLEHALHTFCLQAYSVVSSVSLNLGIFPRVALIFAVSD
jgi:hypothetical protein